MNKQTQPIPIQILSFEDACRVQGITTDLPDVSNFPEPFRKNILNYYKLSVISKALNGEWKADFTNPNQTKYYPWFYVSGGFAAGGAIAGPFSAGTTYAASNAYTYFGARLASKDRNTAIFFGEHFIDIWREFFLE